MSPRAAARPIAASTILALAVATLAACTADGAPPKSKQFQQNATVGTPLVLRLDGKPKMGFVWRLNEGRSSGLNLVGIDRLGWTFAKVRRGSGSFTKPGTLRYAVDPRSAGSARLVFEYFRKEPGASPSATWTYGIDIQPRQ